jgi:hypothetical protein
MSEWSIFNRISERGTAGAANSCLYALTTTAPHENKLAITIIVANRLTPATDGAAAALLDHMLANSRIKVGAAKIVWMTANTIKIQVRSIIHSPNVMENGIANHQSSCNPVDKVSPLAHRPHGKIQNETLVIVNCRPQGALRDF